MINFPDSAKEKIEEIAEIVLSLENDKLKNSLVNSILTNDSKLEQVLQLNQSLVNKINENCIIKNITKNKNTQIITEMMYDLILELKEIQKINKIEKSESELLENLNENSYNEFLRLKNQLNSE